MSEKQEYIVESNDLDESIQKGGSKHISSDIERLNHDIYNTVVLDEYIHLKPIHLNNKIDK